MDADEILPATTEEREEEPDPHSISDQNPVQSTSQEQGGSNKENEGNKDEEEAIISIDDIDKVKLLYKAHQILDVIFGILFASLAVLRWNKGRAEFDGATILICLVDFSVHILVWVLPQSMMSRNYAGLETYMRTAAMALDVYAALLMVDIQYIIIGIIPFMIFLFIGELAWKRKSRETDGASQYNSSEEVLFAKNLFELFSSSSKNSDRLVCFEVISYLLQLSMVTWTQYKRQQGCTPILSDFLLFLASALGALGAMLASPLAGVNSRAVSIQVLPVLNKTCTVLLLVAVQTLAAEWLGEDMIFVCLPELIVVLVWFTICFGQAMSVSSFTSQKSQVTIISSVVAMLAYLTTWQANDRNMQVSWIIWVFWISLSSSALSGFHAWLLLGWPGSTSESNKLIHLLKVASTVGSCAAVILCASVMLTDPRILIEAISSFQHKTIAAVVPIIFLLTLGVWYALPETQNQRSLAGKKYCVVGEVFTHMLVKKLYAKLDELLKAQALTPSDRTFVQSTLKHMQRIITLFESSSDVKDKSWIGLIHDLACEIEDWVDIDALKPKGFMGRIHNKFKMKKLQWRVRNAMKNAPANPAGPDIYRDKLKKKTIDRLTSIVGMPTAQELKDGYYQLDVELKICLLYLSIFPVEQVIEVERLVRLWIAEGLTFIYGQHHPRTNQEKVRIAESYIGELDGRNLIMCTSKGMKRTISIDPAIHSFIVSMSMEQNFITLVHSEQEDVSPSNGTIRRLSLLNNGKEDQAAARTYGKNLQSVTVFNNIGGMPPLAEMTRLRVLDLEGCKGPVCLDDLHKLVFLKYLGLRGTDVSELPAQIEKLTCLETLDVRATMVKEIPLDILSLQKLMHLLAGNAKLPCEIGEMKTLFALSCPNVATNSTSIMHELSKIDNLTELELICESSQMVAFPRVGFHSLHKLSVQFGYSSLIFETDALPNVEVLELKLDKGLPEESTRVSSKGLPQVSTGVAGIERLRNLNHVHVKYSPEFFGMAMYLVHTAARYPKQHITVTEEKVDE